MNSVFETALGYTAVANRGETVLALTFGHSTERSAVRELANRVGTRSLSHFSYEYLEGGDLFDRLHAFSIGAPTDFDDLSIDLSDRTEFQRKVIQACRAIPWGSTRTYGELAEDSGYPGAARAVGSVMASNRVPLIVPCHRVVAASGRLGGFSAPRGVAMKLRLLALEGSSDALSPTVTSTIAAI